VAYQLIDCVRTNGVDDVKQQLKNKDNQEKGGHGSGYKDRAC
jgi:hypothetical protein